MADENLQALVRRRLFELGITAQEASRASQWVIAPQTIEHLAAGKRSGLVSERLARGLAMAIGVPENRIRRLVGLPLVHDPRASIVTGPHLRLIRGGSQQ
jgi:hypothetical protein